MELGLQTVNKICSRYIIDCLQKYTIQLFAFRSSSLALQVTSLSPGVLFVYKTTECNICFHNKLLPQDRAQLSCLWTLCSVYVWLYCSWLKAGLQKEAFGGIATMPLCGTLHTLDSFSSYFISQTNGLQVFKCECK